MISAMDSVDKALFSDKLHFKRTVAFRGIKRVVNGKIVAMIGMDSWLPNSVQMSVWSDHGLSKVFLQEAFKYAFTHVGVALITVRCNNTASLELVRRLGFRTIVTIKDGHALGTDLAIQEMRREECRWIRQEVQGEQEQRHSNAA